jgi:two-component system, OmpR family, response regulator VicR
MAGTWTLRRLFVTREKENAETAETQMANDVVEVGDFTINTCGHTASLRGEPLGLTDEEFDVLVFLTNNRQRFVTPQTLLATNWTKGRPHQTEFLRVLLSLQRKLETVARGQQYLKTEPWVIYRFDAAPSTAR